MANMVVISEVKKLAAAHGKWVSKDFIAYLNRRVSDIVVSNCKALGSRKTLNSLDANAKEALASLSR